MLANLINQHALTEAQSGKWGAVAEILNAPTVEMRNPKSWTMADLIGLVGAQAAAKIGGTIQAAGTSNPIFAGAWIALNVTGLQIHTDDRQSMLVELSQAGDWGSELTAIIKAAGLTYTSLAVNPVTAEQCEASYESARLSQQWSTLQNETINPAAGIRADLIASLKSAIETLEAG